MKKTKICFNKSIGIVFLVALFVGIFTFLAFRLTIRPTSTNTRASTPEENRNPSKSLPIIGGGPAADGEFPFHATLFTKGGWLFCGGTLISEEWVLTAGHCIDDYFINNPAETNITGVEVIIGLDHLNKELKALHNSTVDKYFIHEDFYHPNNGTAHEWNDVALLHLVKPAKGVPTLSLFNPNGGISLISLEELGVNQKVTIMGFGAISTDQSSLKLSYDLKKAETLSIQSRGWFDYSERFKLTSSDGSNTGKGDSGSPALYTYNGRSYVVGIFSYRDGTLTLYTSTSNFYSWINGKTSIKGDSGTYSKNSTILNKKAITICTDITTLDACNIKTNLCTWDTTNKKCINDPKGR